MRYYEKNPDGSYKPDDVEHLVQSVVSTQRLEGIIMTDEEISKLRDYASGKISKAEYKDWARRYVSS